MANHKQLKVILCYIYIIHWSFPGGFASVKINKGSILTKPWESLGFPWGTTLPSSGLLLKVHILQHFQLWPLFTAQQTQLMNKWRGRNGELWERNYFFFLKKKTCFWREKDILWTLKKHVCFYKIMSRNISQTNWSDRLECTVGVNDYSRNND